MERGTERSAEPRGSPQLPQACETASSLAKRAPQCGTFLKTVPQKENQARCSFCESFFALAG